VRAASLTWLRGRGRVQLASTRFPAAATALTALQRCGAGGAAGSRLVSGHASGALRLLHLHARGFSTLAAARLHEGAERPRCGLPIISGAACDAWSGARGRRRDRAGAHR